MLKPCSTYSSETFIPQHIDELYGFSGARDARFADIRSLQVSNADLLNMQMDNTTLLSPEQSSLMFQAQQAMKDPGLGARELHKSGVTGQGVKIAVIDQPLGMHNEYAGKILHYEEIGYEDKPDWTKEGALHGAGTVSMINGNNCGIAPGSQIVYFAADNVSYDKNDIKDYVRSMKTAKRQTKNKEYKNYLKSQIKFFKQHGNEQGAFVSKNSNYAKAIRRVIEMNKSLPQNERIPVISVSWGFDELAPDYPDLIQAINEATAEGIFVVSGSMNNMYGLNVLSADRDASKDVNDPLSYEEGIYSKSNGLSKTMSKEAKDNTLLLPTEHRTMSDFKSPDGYIYNGKSDGSGWNAPYLAGMYALTKQVNPDITPLDFFRKAILTSNECHNADGTYVGRLINPQDLVDAATRSDYVPSSDSPFANDTPQNGRYIPSPEAGNFADSTDYSNYNRAMSLADSWEREAARVIGGFRL